MSIKTLIVRNDELGFYALNKKIHCQVLNPFMKLTTHLGSTTFAVLTCITSIVCCKQLSVVLILNLILSQIVIQSLKRVINRPRPYKTLDWAVAIKPPKCRYSLPSGHSSAALSITLSILYFFPELKAILLVVAVIVGISRVYLGYHYPSDVLIGFLISFIVFQVVIL